MKRSLRIALLGITTLLMLVLVTYGAWIAWDRGLIGNNPRAPIAAAMEAAVRRQALVNVVKRNSSPDCLSVDLNRPAPEIQGRPGIGFGSVPGRFAVSLLRQTNNRDQPARDLQLVQLDYLASQGLFAANDENIDTTDGLRPARSYQMSWEGYAVSNQERYGQSPCLIYGRREFAGIENIERLPERVMDLEVYEVTYAVHMENVPAWAKTPEVERVFPKLGQAIADSREKAKVIRTKDGWRSAYEVEMEAAAAQVNKGAHGGDYFKQMLSNLERPAPSLSEVSNLLTQNGGEPTWLARHAIACLPLNLQRGGDEKPQLGSVRDDPTFVATYYDRGDRKEYEFRNMARALHILSSLVNAGLARMDVLQPAPAQKSLLRRDQPPIGSAVAMPGIRFVLPPETVEALGLSSSSGCIPAGRIKADPIAVHDNRGSWRLSARGNVEQTPEWVERIAGQLPAMQSLIKNGLPMVGTIALDEKDKGKWRLMDLSPMYPEISYSALPAYLVPLLPQTAAANPGKKPKAPSVALDGAVPPSTSGPQPAPPPPAFDAMPSPQPAPAPGRISAITLPAVPLPQLQQAQGRPPFPSEGAAVHVVSVYGATSSGERTEVSREHAMGVANLLVEEPGAMLVLFAYEPVEWRIDVAKGGSLKKVVAIGNYEPHVSLARSVKPEIVAGTAQGLQNVGIDLRNWIPTGHEANDLVDIAMIVRALTGVLPRSYQGARILGKDVLAISSRVAPFAMPTPKYPEMASESSLLRASSSDAVSGDTLQRGTSGAYTEAWSERIYSAGRIYFEGRMRVTGSLSGHTHANIGLCMARGRTIDTSMSDATRVIAHGEQKLYADGDIFGIAADFDKSSMHYHVNGRWVTGAPGSGNGISLQKNKEYRACVFAAGTTSGEVQRGRMRSDTTWEVNFGNKPFSISLPTGYLPFKGRV